MNYQPVSRLFFLCFIFIFPMLASSQMITGVWKGRIHKQKVEVKIIQQGDSLTGTSYYYESATNYRRYSIRGYFDAVSNEAVWWDDVLLESRQGRGSLTQPGKVPLLSRADFNCPGEGRMMLDGKAGPAANEQLTGIVDLDKINETSFPDEWDYVIDNYLTGTNDPDIIDSIAGLAVHRIPAGAEPEKQAPPPVEKVAAQKVPVPAASRPAPVPPVIVAALPPVPPPTIEQKFTARQKVFIKEIPLHGDSLELRFYDNAEIDGDSISLFLNDKLLFSHIRLLGSAYTIRLAIADLQDTNELVMVAENLGSIPPNTSYMVAQMGEERYDARLESTEGSSAMIRLVKRRE